MDVRNRGELGRGERAPRGHMPLEDRAKIFVPFDPLQGFREALRQKEREVEKGESRSDEA